MQMFWTFKLSFGNFGLGNCFWLLFPKKIFFFGGGDFYNLLVTLTVGNVMSSVNKQNLTKLECI